MIPPNPHRLDAEACGKMLVEIIKRRKEKIWSKVFKSEDERDNYIYCLAVWAFHWANLTK